MIINLSNNKQECNIGWKENMSAHKMCRYEYIEEILFAVKKWVAIDLERISNV